MWKTWKFTSLFGALAHLVQPAPRTLTLRAHVMEDMEDISKKYVSSIFVEKLNVDPISIL
jgi:hypothetical protein